VKKLLPNRTIYGWAEMEIAKWSAAKLYQVVWRVLGRRSGAQKKEQVEMCTKIVLSGV